MVRFVSLAFTCAILAGFALAQEHHPAPASRPASQLPATATPDQPLAVTVPTFPNRTCAIMGKPISEKLYVDTEKGRIYMCCKACTKKILADVAKAHQTAYPVIKRTGNTTCPNTGKKIEKDSPTVVVQGYEVPVCCEDCAKEVQEDAQVVLALVTNPKLVDLGNRTCPITGKPVEKNAFCLIGNHLVRLSSPECVEDVKKDPAKTLAKAKAIKAKQPEDSERGHGGHGDAHDGHGKEKGKGKVDEKPKEKHGHGTGAR